MFWYCDSCDYAEEFEGYPCGDDWPEGRMGGVPPRCPNCDCEMELDDGELDNDESEAA